MVTGCYGDPVVETPHLNRLASEGALLDNVYATSPLCAPARMSLLTGRHPYQNQVWDNDHILSSSIPAFTHAMGAVGYRPQLIGRLHARGPDQLIGYVDRQVGDHGPSYIGAPQAPRGNYAGTAGPDTRSLKLSGPGQSGYQVRDEHAAAEAIAFLDRMGIDRRAGLMTNPFSLTVGLMLPHPPYIARAEDYERYDGKVPPPRTHAVDTDPEFIRWWRNNQGIETIPSDQLDRMRTAYWACVHRLDTIIGTILDALQRNDLTDDTIVVYTSDHGDHVGEHGLAWKHTFYEESIRVPGIIRWPSTIPPGIRTDHVISTLDLTATMVDAVDSAALPGSSGRSLLPLLRGTSMEWDDIAFAETGLVGDIARPQRMIRIGKWKLWYSHNDPPALYDLDTDPHETRNLASNPAYADVIAQLSSKLFDGWDPQWVADTMALKKQEVAMLSAWWQTVQPPEPHRFDLKPEATYLA